MTDPITAFWTPPQPQRVICARCQTLLQAGPAADSTLSHGLCAACLDRIAAGGAFADALGSLAIPAVVTNEDLQILSANPAAERLLGKPAARIKGLRAGAAVDCHYASLNGGCGTTAHCRSCTVRHSVGATYADGQPRYGVVTHHELAAGGAVRQVEVRFSTTKLRSLMFLLIEDVRLLGAREEARLRARRLFADEFCAAHLLPPDRYLPAMFGRSLTWWTRLLRPALCLFAPDFFAADRELLTRVGMARRPEDVLDAIAEFEAHPANRRMLRRLGRLRVSCREVMRLYSEVEAPPRS